MAFRTDTVEDLDDIDFKICFLHFKASWTVWCHFNTNADTWSQLCVNVLKDYLHLWVFLSKTPSQIQSDVIASTVDYTTKYSTQRRP